MNRKDNKGRNLRTGESQRKDGRYEYKYTDTDGKRKSVYSWRLVKTDRIPKGKKDDASLRELEEDIQKRKLLGKVDSEDEVTLKDVFYSCINNAVNLKKRTKRLYIGHYERYVGSTYMSDMPIGNIEYKDYMWLISSMIEERGMEGHSVRTVLSPISVAINEAIVNGYVSCNYLETAIKKIKSTKGIENSALTKAEENLLVDFVKNSARYKKQMYPIIVFLLETGLRISELCALQFSDCDFHNKVIHVNKALSYYELESGVMGYEIGSTKTASGVREIPMTDNVEAVIRQKLREKHERVRGDKLPACGYSDFIFVNKNGNPIVPSSMTRCFQNIVNAQHRKEKVDAEREGRDPVFLPKTTPHTLRHTFCTRMCEFEPNIKVIQTLMGHASASTTIAVYNNITPESLYNGMDKMNKYHEEAYDIYDIS